MSKEEELSKTEDDKDFVLYGIPPLQENMVIRNKKTSLMDMSARRFL